MVKHMDTSKKTPGIILASLRREHNYTQNDLAEILHITREAISRWERDEALPNTESLKTLSGLYNVTINTLLGAPKQLICQVCGAPLDDTTTSREVDGSFNEEYCKWCYHDGQFVYHSMEELLNYLAEHLSNAEFPPEAARAYFAEQLPRLRYWQNHPGQD